MSITNIFNFLFNVYPNYVRKKPQMPPEEATRAVLPPHVLAHQAIQLSRTHVLDFDFLKRVITEPNTSEFSGFNTKSSREQGQSAQPATRAIYTPLIDMTPADPDTMMTAMVQAQKLTKECGQEITTFTNDQQLYKVAVNVTWVYRDRFSLLIPRLGGMYLLMSCIGSVEGGGGLMTDSGLEEIVNSSFGGVPNMFAGKQFPRNSRALRIVVEVDTYESMREVLETNASQSKTT